MAITFLGNHLLCKYQMYVLVSACVWACVCGTCIHITHTLRIRHVIVEHADNLMPAICENRIPTHLHIHTVTHTRKHTLCLNIFPFINFAPYTCTYNLQQPLDNLSSLLAISIVPHHVVKGSSSAARMRMNRVQAGNRPAAFQKLGFDNEIY